METKLKGILLCITENPYEIDGKKGISYRAFFYSNRKVITCKPTSEVVQDIKEQENLDGEATIEIKQTNYNNKEKVEFLLKKFEY